MTEPLIDQPDWPDRSKWERDFTAQFLHDVDTPVRDATPWNDAEVQAIVDQRLNDVSFEEIARRHQRRVQVVMMLYAVAINRLTQRLLR